MIEISEVQIIPIKPRDGLVGFASVVINEAVYLGSIGIHTRIDGSGYRITYPTKSIGNRSLNVFHPINHEASSVIERAVLEKCKEVMESSDDRYNSTEPIYQ